MGILRIIEDGIHGWANLVLNGMVGWNSEDMAGSDWVSPTLSITDDLVAGDIFNITINGFLFSETYATSHIATLSAIINDINESLDMIALGVSAALNLDDTTSRSMVITAEEWGVNITTQIINGGTGKAMSGIIPIVWLHENGAIPDQSYLSLHIISSPIKMMPWKGGVTIYDQLLDPTNYALYPNGRQTIFWTEEHLVSVQAYGKFADDFLEAIKVYLDFDQVQAYLDDNQLSATITGPIHDLSEIVDMQSERRCEMDVTFRVSLTIYDQPGYITGITGSGVIGTHAVPIDT